MIGAAISLHALELLPSSLVMAAWSCSTMGATQGAPVFSSVSEAACQRFASGGTGGFSANDIALLAWIFGRKGIRDIALFELLMQAALAALEDFAPSDLANLTTGLARLSLGSEHRDVLSAVLQKAACTSASFSTEEWQRLGWAFTRLGTPGTLDVFAPRFLLASAEVAKSVHEQLSMLRCTRGLPCLQSLCERPPVVMVTGFISADETNQLLDLSMGLWERVPPDTPTVELCGPKLEGHPTVQALLYRAEALMSLPKGHAENVRIMRRRPKDPATPGSDVLVEDDVKAALALPSPDPRHPTWSALRGGQRVAAIQIYLAEGGRRHFGRLGLEAAPPRGAALVWPLVRKNGAGEQKWACCEGEESSGGCSAWIWLRSEVVPRIGHPRTSLCGA